MSLSRPTARWLAVTVTTTLLLSVSVVAASAAPPQQACDRRVNNTYEKVLECTRVEGVREHQAALQSIADEFGGTRSEGTPGYDASVDYVVATLAAAGWQVSAVPFTYNGSRATLDQAAPVAASHPSLAITGSGAGDVTGNVVPVDLSLADPNATTSGCQTTDFDGLDFSGDNDIALIQRGVCTFATKAGNALAAGAEAVVVGNQGIPGRISAYGGVTLSANFAIPVVTASFAALTALSAEGSSARVAVEIGEITSQNVIAELRGRNDDNVVMAGAHLDSRIEGPGLQDNGSGSAALLEVAEVLARVKPQNTVRLGWWGNEEGGLVGSTRYVAGLSEGELDRIALYLNFDMVGSPNYVFQVYDADESTFDAPVVVPDGSIAIEDTFESFYTLVGEPYDDSAFSGRSDYQAFINNDIPSSGLFTGAEVIKTPAQEAIWGGTAGAQFDPCYHQACDTYDNISLHALDVNADAMAFAILTYAYSTESVNGVVGKPVETDLVIPAPAGPQGTFG